MPFARIASRILILLIGLTRPLGADELPSKTFRVWATSCAHVPADIRRGRESLADVIRQSEGLVKDAPAFDAPYYDHGAGTWFQKWGDPLGRHTEFSGVNPERRPFPVEGTWERYRFQAGNMLFLMLADRNDAPEPVGRGHSKDDKSGGYPAGAVTRDTFNW